MKRALLIVLVLMIISTVWCQNGTPTVLSAQISVPGNDVSDILVIGDYVYIASWDFLTKYDLSSKEILWSQAFPVSYANSNCQGMFKTLNNHLVITYDGIVTKMSTEDDTLWQVTLPGRVALTLDSIRNRIVCYSWSGLLTVLNLDNGQTLLQRQMPFDGYADCGYHNAVATSDNEFILSDNTIYGVNWNSAVMISKVSVTNGVTDVVWQHTMTDFTTCNIKWLDSNKFYLTARELGVGNNYKIFFFEDLGSSYVVTDSIDAGGPEVRTFLNASLLVGSSVLTIGGNILGSDVDGEDGGQAVFTIYDSQGETRTSQVNAQTDFTIYQGLTESNGRVYTVLITQDYCYGPRTFYLTELTGIYNSAVTTDPDTPATPSVKFNLLPHPN